jgi:mono/diheme cytochrome c family protein
MTGVVRCVGRIGLALGLGAGLATAVAMAQAPKAKQAAASAADGKTLTFSRDIAPVLVGNCVGCHSPSGKAAKKFDMSTFQKLRAGGVSGGTITPGKPEESELVLRIKGESEGPKMPPGNDKDIAAETIAKIEEWIKAGAILDAGPGHTPDAPLTAYAATPESLRREELARMTPEQQEEKLTAVALDRWKKGSANTTPEKTSSPHFLMFGQLPQERAEAILKQLEGQYLALRGLLGQPGAMALNGPEKLSIYVFNDRTQYVEFVRGLENRDIEMGTEAHANFGVESPYLAAADPLNGRDDPTLGQKPSTKVSRKKQDEEFEGPERSLSGLLAEQMGIAALTQAGKPPRWLSLGFGAYLGSLLEPRSPYYRHLRNVTFAQAEAGWMTKSVEALGGDTEEEKVRAIGFSMIEWLASAFRLQFPVFTRGMLAGPEKLDDQLGKVFNASRQEFLGAWYNWIGAHYRRTR